MEATEIVTVSNGDFPWADRMRQMVTHSLSKHLLNAHKSVLADFLVNKTNSSPTLMEIIISRKFIAINTELPR